MESVYIETSVVSYLVARPPARTVSHQWHVWTKDWWRLRRPYFECVISAEVLREAAAGDQKQGGINFAFPPLPRQAGRVRRRCAVARHAVLR